MSLGLVFGLLLFTQDQWIYVTAWALAHYLLSFVYSVKGIQLRKENFSRLFGLALLIVTAMYCGYRYQQWILWFFGFHHVLSETYAYKNELRPTGKLLKNIFYLSGFIFQSLLFLNIVSYDPLFQKAISQNILQTALLGSSLLFVSVLYFVLRLQERKLKWEIVQFQVIGASFLFYNYLELGSSINLIHIILYHIFYWSFWPLSKMKNFKDLGIYSVLTITAFAGFLLWMKPDFYQSEKTWLYYVEIFKFWGFFHIVTSIGLSADNPRFISEFFRWKKES